ncbi:hypothetical protein FHX44_113954 [Pseudonocardia hierapolitana]|uniref:Uncharacterized protein n=1 Tax=Pseudonocardia hierapolitana TaxID=1128676 RepID=A0A561ST61_9PSEU|nr:hypothetical protein [Pseudonocardia hierapolitana]TWF78035.1 hypothetical protein FHX44_113954 [Pseudonocardia hierapolitana]
MKNQFESNSINASVVQISDVIANLGPVLAMSEAATARSRLTEVRNRVDELTRTGAVDQARAEEMLALTRAAEAEMGGDQPDRGRAITALTRLKSVAEGLTATAGIAEAIDGIVRTLAGA